MIRVAFRAKRPMNYEMFRPLHARLAGDSRVEVVLYGKQHGRSDKEVLAAALPARRRPNWTCKFTSPDLLVQTDFLLATRRAKVAVQIFHGISIKNFFLNERIHDFDAVFAVGPYMVRRYIERGFFEEGDPRLRPVGMPKTDRLLDGSLDALATRAAAGLSDPARPTVLYAPSWGQESSLDRMGEDVLAALARWPGNVLVKLHDNAFDPRYARRDWRALLDGLRGPRFAVPKTWDVVPLLHAADLLVTDISSVAFEYVQLDRPILFLTFENQLGRWEGKADLETWGRRIGTELSDAATLPAAIEAALSDADRLGEVRRAARDDIFFNAGRSTEVAVRELYALAGLPPPAAPR